MPLERSSSDDGHLHEPIAGPPLFVVVSAFGAAFFITDVIIVATDVYVRTSWDVVLGTQNSAFANLVVILSVPVTVVATAASLVGILPLRRWMMMAPWKPVLMAAAFAGVGAKLIWLLPISGLDLAIRRLFLLSAPPVVSYCLLAFTKRTTSRATRSSS